jgi:hypothetical protein
MQCQRLRRALDAFEKTVTILVLVRGFMVSLVGSFMGSFQVTERATGLGIILCALSGEKILARRILLQMCSIL